MSILNVTKANWQRLGWATAAVAAVEVVGSFATLTPWWASHLLIAAFGGLAAYFLDEKFAELK